MSGAKAVISTHTAGYVQDCYLVDLATGELVRTDERVSSSSTLRFSPDGKMIVTMERNSLVLRDAATGRVLNRFRGYSDPVCSLAFSPDGALLRSLDRRGNFKEWVANPAKAIVLEGANAQPSGGALSPNAVGCRSSSERRRSSTSLAAIARRPTRDLGFGHGQVPHLADA